jgi:YCII-related domain
MAKYVFAYKGGKMAETDEERQAAMQAWGAWFGALGPAVVDAGNPFAGSKAVGGNGTSGLTGYSILSADSIDAASKLAEDCPVLSNGGNVEVYEVLEVM